MQPLMRGVAGSQAGGCSSWCVGLQPLPRRRACILAAFCCHVSPSSCRLSCDLRCSRHCTSSAASASGSEVLSAALPFLPDLGAGAGEAMETERRRAGETPVASGLPPSEGSSLAPSRPSSSTTATKVAELMPSPVAPPSARERHVRKACSDAASSATPGASSAKMSWQEEVPC